LRPGRASLKGSSQRASGVRLDFDDGDIRVREKKGQSGGFVATNAPPLKP